MKKPAFWAFAVAALALVFCAGLRLFGSEHSLPEGILLIAALGFFFFSGAWYLLERKQAVCVWHRLARVLAALFFLFFAAALIFWLHAGGSSEDVMKGVLEGIYQ